MKTEKEMPAQVGPIISSRSCSWCHHLNDTRVEFCERCRHCAQLPRMQCYCSDCSRRLKTPIGGSGMMERARINQTKLNREKRESQND